MATRTPINGVLKYWPMIIVVFALAISMGTNMANLDSAEADIGAHEQRIQSIEKDLGEINTSIGKIETTQGFTRTDISDIKSALESLVRQLGTE